MQGLHQGGCTCMTGYLSQSGKKSLAGCEAQGEGNRQTAVALHDREMLF